MSDFRINGKPQASLIQNLKSKIESVFYIITIRLDSKNTALAGSGRLSIASIAAVRT